MLQSQQTTEETLRKSKSDSRIAQARWFLRFSITTKKKPELRWEDLEGRERPALGVDGRVEAQVLSAEAAPEGVVRYGGAEALAGAGERRGGARAGLGNDRVEGEPLHAFKPIIGGRRRRGRHLRGRGAELRGCGPEELEGRGAVCCGGGVGSRQTAEYLTMYGSCGGPHLSKITEGITSVRLYLLEDTQRHRSFKIFVVIKFFLQL